MLAADGWCKTLDAAASGYVRAEAAGALMLEMVTEAHAQAYVAAVVAGSAVNQDGRSSGLTAPNGPAQQEVVRAALTAAGMAAAALSAVQLHGTGTSLGDPIEVGALAAVMASPAKAGGASSAARRSLALMAGKSLIGHSEPAAGVMGLAHAHLAVAQRASLPLLHLHSGELSSAAGQQMVGATFSPVVLPVSPHCPPAPQSTPTLPRPCTRASGACPASPARCRPTTRRPSAASARLPSKAPMRMCFWQRRW